MYTNRMWFYMMYSEMWYAVDLHTVRVAVAGGVTENGGVFVQLIPAADFVFTMGIIAAPHGVLTVFIQL
jgi:hypothetical protein